MKKAASTTTAPITHHPSLSDPFIEATQGAGRSQTQGSFPPEKGDWERNGSMDKEGDGNGHDELVQPRRGLRDVAGIRLSILSYVSLHQDVTVITVTKAYRSNSPRTS